MELSVAGRPAVSAVDVALVGTAHMSKELPLFPLSAPAMRRVQADMKSDWSKCSKRLRRRS